MKTGRYSDAQIMGNMARMEGRVLVLCREHGKSNASYHKWRAMFGGMESPLLDLDPR